MPDMLKDVAAVIAGTYQLETNDELYPLPESLCLALARSAIDAMREPAGAPLDAAVSALYRHYFGDGGFIGTEAAKEQILLTHRAIIDAALNPAPSPSDTNPLPAQPIADHT